MDEVPTGAPLNPKKGLSMRFTIALGLATLLTAGGSGSITSSTEMVFDPPQDQQPPDQDVVATFSMIQEQILGPSCALSGCHADFEFPRLSSSQAYESIVGVMSSSGQPLIDPGEPTTSYLYLKVIGDESIGGGIMPRGGPRLSAARIELLRSWIVAGALND